MLELDLIIGKYVKNRVKNFSKEECDKFEREIFFCETPELYELLVGKRSAEKIENETINLIRESI